MAWLLPIAVLVVTSVAAGLTGGLMGSGSTTSRSGSRSGTATDVVGDFRYLVAESGLTAQQQTALDRALSRVRLTVDGHDVPSWFLFVEVMGLAKEANLLGSGDSSALDSDASLARGAAAAAKQVLLLSDGRRAGIVPNERQMRRFEQTEIAAAKRGAPLTLPHGWSPTRYFHSTEFERSYADSYVVSHEEARIVRTSPGSQVHPGDDAAFEQRLRDWARQEFPARVRITGIPGVSAENLATFLPG